MTIYTLDFETYYEKRDYSLSKMTTQEYITDPRFQVIGVSIAVDNDAPIWHSYADHDAYRDALAPLHGAIVLAHNAAFDCAILDELWGIQPSFILDTLSMAKPLHGLTVGGSLKALAKAYNIGAKGTEIDDANGLRREDFTPDQLARYGQYCSNDVALTRDLFAKLRPRTRPDELRLIDQTIKCFTRPLLHLDANVLAGELERLQTERNDALAAAGADLETLGSAEKFADALRALGVEPQTKEGKRGPTYAFAKTDDFMRELQSHPDNRVQALAAARLRAKSTLGESRTERFLTLSQLGPLRVPLSYCGAVTTWRWSGADNLNLQNLPRGGALRRAIVAPEGHQLVVADSSNIELRVNHTLAGREDSIQAFRDGRDLYKEFASRLYHVAVDEVTKEQRFTGKVAHLMLQYQSGAPKFKATAANFGLTLTDDEAQQIVDLYRSMYSAIAHQWNDAQRAVRAMATGSEMDWGHGVTIKTRKNLLLTPPQHYIQYPQLTRTADGYSYLSRRFRQTETVHLYGGKLVENVVQHISRNIVAEQWLRVAQRYPIALQVHDEIVAVVPDDQAEDALAYMIDTMATPPDWWPDLPLAAEGDIAPSYGDAK